MKIEHLEDLIEVATCKSINKAAANLYMAQPALSAIISSIEKELGFPVFNRFNRGVELTAQGEKVISDSKNILNMYYNWKELSSTDIEIEDQVSIAAPWIVCSMFFPRNILELRRTYPKLSVKTYEMTPTDIIDQISAGNNMFSIGVIFTRADQMADTVKYLSNQRIPWNAEVIYNDEDVLVIGKNSPYYTTEVLSREMLSNITLIKYSTGENRPAVNLDVFGFKDVVEAATPEQILAMVANSDMAAFLPASWMNSNYLNMSEDIRFFYTDEILGIDNMKTNSGYILISKPMNRLSAAEKIVLKELKSNFRPIRSGAEQMK